MASIANFFLMALLILLAISKQALPRKSKSENADVKQLDFLLRSEPNPGIEPDRSPPPNIPSSTPYTASDEYIPGEDHTMVPNFGYSAPEPEPPRVYIPYPGIPPTQSVQNNIPSYTAYAGIAPRTPHLSIPSYTLYTGSDRYIPKKPPRLGVPSKTPYTGIPPKKLPHNNIPSYTSYIRGEDDTREPDPERVGSVPAADRP